MVAEYSSKVLYLGRGIRKQQRLRDSIFFGKYLQKNLWPKFGKIKNFLRGSILNAKSVKKCKQLGEWI